MDGKSLSRELTRRTDSTIAGLFKSRFGTKRPPWAIVALGGYGRQDLCPFSDVDILLLTRRKTAKDEIDKALHEMLYPLWDEGYTVSYSVRTTRQVLDDSRSDFFLRTSLLDARFVCGEKTLFDELEHAMAAHRHFRDAGSFIRNLHAHVKKRHDLYGDTSYILEPDIKEGHGGLRDYHCILWVMKVYSYAPLDRGFPAPLSSMDAEELDKAVGFLLKVRFSLHEASGRKNDRLFFEYQETLASSLGYESNGYETGAELFMRHFHRSALIVKSISDAVLSQYAFDLSLERHPGERSIGKNFKLSSGRLCFTEPEKISERPELLLDLFAHMSDLGAAMSSETRHKVREALELLALGRQNRDAKNAFIRILTGNHPAMALVSMQETGVLESFLPEYEPIKGRTHFDVYHTYTTDLHSIITVQELKSLENHEPDVFARVADKEVLYLAAFLHDIGKGYGRPHACTGAPIAHEIASWLGFSDTRADQVAFLVRHHLLLPDTADKRDLSEEKVVLDCAQTVRDPRALSMLYLLSIADSKATGPRAWNDWRATLLRELYLKTLHSLQRGILRDPRNMIVLEQTWSQLISRVPTELGSRHGGRLWALPQAYILDTEPEAIKRHLELGARLASREDLFLDSRERGEHTSLTMITRDRPGLFAMLTGLLAVNHLDVVSAKVFTWLDGIAVDEFTVVTPWKDSGRWEKITKEFGLMASGAVDIGKRVSTTRPLKNGCTCTVSADPAVTLDNDLSDFFTVIEVRASQKFGLLFRMAQAISSLGLDIHRAFLTHTMDPCTDVFYVVDESGEKITDSAVEDRVKRTILQAI